MNLTITTFQLPGSGGGDSRGAPYYAIVRADGHKALGEGSSERSAAQDGLNGYFTARSNAETVEKNTNVVVHDPDLCATDFSITLDLPAVSFESPATYKALNYGVQAQAAAKLQWPVESDGAAIIGKRIATDSRQMKSLLEEARDNDLLLNIIYTKEGGERSERQIKVAEVEDRSLATGRLSGPSSTYIVGVDMRLGEPRTFRLDRFESVELVG